MKIVPRAEHTIRGATSTPMRPRFTPREADHVAYLVGGSVRDLPRPPPERL
jgi:hypothetical protein